VAVHAYQRRQAPGQEGLELNTTVLI
jgi:hypothetical protein